MTQASPTQPSPYSDATLLKFVQIATGAYPDGHSVYGLDEGGRVWCYVESGLFWRPLSMGIELL